MIRKSETAFTFMILLFFTARILPADVIIVRKVPISGENHVQAQWTKPQPDPERAQLLGRTEFSGRFSVGGTGGNTAAGSAVYGLFTDSNFKLIQPLGQSANLQVIGKGLRETSLTGTGQDYGGELGLNLEKINLNLTGAYADSSETVAGVLKDEMDANLKTSLVLSVIPTLPINLSYQTDWLQKNDDGIQTEKSHTDMVDLASSGTLGSLGVELAGNLQNEYDSQKGMTALGTGGSLALTVPTLSFLSIMGSVAPNYNRTEYSTGNSLTSNSLESSLGLLFPLSEVFEARIVSGRVDSWTKEEGSLITGAQPYLLTWKGEIGADLTNLSGFSASPAYKLAKTIEGNLSQNLATTLGWLNEEEGFFRNIDASAELDYTSTEAGSVVADEKKWSSGFQVSPAEMMNLKAAYSGGYRGASENEWNHNVEASYDHEPDPLLNYLAAFNLSHTYSTANRVLKHEYLGAVNLKPQWKLLVYSFGISENLSVTQQSSGEDILSTAGYTMALPISRFLQTRYGFDWEWIGRTAPGAGPGNNFKNLAGLTLSGETLPLSLTTEYAFSNGYRGIRHDVSSILQVPFRNGFSLNGEFNLSYYLENGQVMVPFLLGFNLVYEF